MKIAFFANGFPIVSEPFIAQTAAALVKAGHDVRIYGIGNVKATAFASSESVQSLLAGRYENVRWPGSYMPRLFLGLEKVVSSTLRHGRVAPLWKPFVYRRHFRDLTAFYLAEVLPPGGRFDILHCHFATLGETVLKFRRAGTLSGKVVVHFRGYDISETVQRAGPRVYDHLWGAADHFVANCEFFRDRIVRLGAPPEKVSVIGSAIDLGQFPYRPPRKIDGPSIDLVAIGRLIQRKGMHTLIEAIAILKGRESAPPRMRLTIIGGGPMEAELKDLAIAREVAGQVVFVGPQPHAVIAAYLRKAHAFVAASMKEANGGEDAPVNTIKEAFAIGVPTVATKHGGIPELVVDGETGVLARENDPMDLALAIERLLALSDQWSEMTLRARKRIEDEYEDGVILRKYERLYDHLLGARAAHGLPPGPDRAVGESAPAKRDGPGSPGLRELKKVKGASTQ